MNLVWLCESSSNSYCVVPENIHPQPQRVIVNSKGGGGVLKAKIFKGKYEPKLEYPEGWGAQTRKTPLWGEYGYFLEQH